MYTNKQNDSGVDTKQNVGTKKEEPQASIGATEPRMGDPGSHVLGHTGNFEGGKPMGSLGRIPENIEGGKPMRSLGGISDNFEAGKPMGSLGGITGRDHWDHW